MNPLEFLKYTPKTNCGDCGHPTCLAFAVAVTKGGVDPGRCPHVDPAALPALAGADGPGLEAVDRGQEERDMALVAHLKSKVSNIDFQAAARTLGARWSPDEPQVLCFRYLGRPVRLGRDDVRMDGEEVVDPRDQILLYNYVAFGGGRVPDGTWIGMESLPNSISKVRTLATYCEMRLADRFSGRAAALDAACARIDGRGGPPGQSATVASVIPVLPHVPLYLLFWDEEPDDGFEARVKVLFDHHVMDFLDLESLVFAAERMADRLLALDKGAP